METFSKSQKGCIACIAWFLRDTTETSKYQYFETFFKSQEGALPALPDFKETPQKLQNSST